MSQAPLTSRALRHLLDRDPVLSRQVGRALRPVPLTFPPIAGERLPWPVAPDAMTEDALLELLRWRLEAHTESPAAVTVHDLLLGALPVNSLDRMTGLTAHVQGLRDRYQLRQTVKPEDLTVTLRWVEQTLSTARPQSVRSLEGRAQHLAWLLAAPWSEEILTHPVEARPTLGDVQVGDVPVFVRVTCRQKIEPEWRLVLGAAALAAAVGAPDPLAIRVGVWSVPHASLRIVGLQDLFPGDDLPDLIEELGVQVAETNWLVLGKVRQPPPLTATSRRNPHPLLALQAVNGRTKVIGALLEQNPRRRDAVDLRREQTYLYELKSRAAQVLLDLGALRPVALDRGALLVVGETPVGPRGFHLPLNRFAAYATRIDGGRKGIPGRIEDAEAVLAHISQDRAVAVLTRLIALKRLT